MYVLALSGWKGSGKDTVADHLVSAHNFIKLSFASILKDMTSMIYNIPREYFDDRDKKELPLLHLPFIFTSDPIAFKSACFWFVILQSHLKMVGHAYYHTPRSLAIYEGMCKRFIQPTYWTDRVIAKMTDPHARYVISDLRFLNEISELKKIPHAEVKFVRVNRFLSTSATDPSERELDSYPDFDLTLANKENQQENTLQTISCFVDPPPPISMLDGYF